MYFFPDIFKYAVCTSQWWMEEMMVINESGHHSNLPTEKLCFLNSDTDSAVVHHGSSPLSPIASKD